jgi:hypothetical protein
VVERKSHKLVVLGSNPSIVTNVSATELDGPYQSVKLVSLTVVGSNPTRYTMPGLN